MNQYYHGPQNLSKEKFNEEYSFNSTVDQLFLLELNFVNFVSSFQSYLFSHWIVFG